MYICFTVQANHMKFHKDAQLRVNGWNALHTNQNWYIEKYGLTLTCKVAIYPTKHYTTLFELYIFIFDLHAVPKLSVSQCFIRIIGQQKMKNGRKRLSENCRTQTNTVFSRGLCVCTAELTTNIFVWMNICSISNKQQQIIPKTSAERELSQTRRLQQNYVQLKF